MWFLARVGILAWLYSTASATSAFPNASITAAPSTTALKPSQTIRSCLYPLQSAVDDGSVEDGNYNDCNRPGDPEVLGGNYNPYEFASWTSVASTCSVSFESALTAWMQTADYHTQTIVYTPEAGGAPYTTEYNVDYNSFFPFQPKEPCCLNCTLYGGNVQVYYWPTPAPSGPPVTKLVNSANFTFVSPSIYVAFNSLYASNLCGHEGKDIPSTTIAFAPGALSTAMAYQYNGTGPDYLNLGNDFKAASFGQDVVCGNITSSFQYNEIDGSTYPYDQPLPSSVQEYCSQSFDNCDFDDFSITYDPCSPTLSVPTQIFSLNPEWKECIQGIDAFFDPPYTLTAGNGLSAFDPPVADPTTGPSAQPANTPSSPVASPTQPPENPNPSPSPTQDPTPSNSPDPSPTNIPDPNTSPDPVATPPANDPPSQNPSLSPDTAPTPAPTSPNQQLPPQPSQSSNPSPADPATPNGQVNTNTPTLTKPVVPIVVGTQTISPGSPAVTIDGTTFSLDASSSALIINGVATQLPNPIAPLDSETFILGSQTLIAGGAAITISSLLVSLMSGGQNVVIGETTTEPLGQVFTSAEIVLPTASTGLGGVIVSLGGFADPSNSGNVGPQATGSGNGTGFNGITVSGLATRTKTAVNMYLWVGGVGVISFGMMVL